MILAFREDGSVAIHASIDAACRLYEGVDVESQVIQFFDADGNRLKPRFTTPNRFWSVFGVVLRSSSGQYTLVLDPDEDADPLWLMLNEAGGIEGPSRFASVDQLREHLARRGAQVEP